MEKKERRNRRREIENEERRRKLAEKPTAEEIRIIKQEAYEQAQKTAENVQRGHARKKRKERKKKEQ